MEYLRESYNKIINSSPEILKEIAKEVSQMNDIALHNYANSMIRNCNSTEIINRQKTKAMATTLVNDLITEILYRER